MADLASTYSMSTTPTIKHTVTYETKRSGTTAYYRFKISTAPLESGGYFGFNIVCKVTLNGKVVATGATLKNASPSSWTSSLVKYLPSSTGWYSVTGVTSAASLSAKIDFSSEQTSGSASSGSRTVSVPAGSPPTAPTLVLSETSVLPDTIVKVGVTGGAWGDSGAGKFTYQYSTDKNKWTAFYTGTAKSANFKPSSYGGKTGSVFYFRVQITNARELSAFTKTLSLTVRAPTSSGAKMRVKVGGAWKTGDVFVKVGGVWKKAEKVYIKSSGQWKGGA